MVSDVATAQTIHDHQFYDERLAPILEKSVCSFSTLLSPTERRCGSELALWQAAQSERKRAEEAKAKAGDGAAAAKLASELAERAEQAQVRWVVSRLRTSLLNDA